MASLSTNKRRTLTIQSNYVTSDQGDIPGETCALCSRRVARTTRHHLIPVTLHKNKWFRKNFTRDQMHTTVPLCRDCHKTVHKFITHKELGREYNTIENLLSHPKLGKFVNWIAKRG